jgi:hypothetical protein
MAGYRAGKATHRQQRSIAAFRSHQPPSGSTCGDGWLSIQINSAALSQSSRDRAINSNAIIRSGRRRTHAFHDFNCNHRSYRPCMPNSTAPGGWFGRRGRSEDAPRGALDCVPSRQFYGNAVRLTPRYGVIIETARGTCRKERNLDNLPLVIALLT